MWDENILNDKSWTKVFAIGNGFARSSDDNPTCGLLVQERRDPARARLSQEHCVHSTKATEVEGEDGNPFHPTSAVVCG